MKKYTIKVCINLEFVKDPTNSQKSIKDLSASVAKMTEHLASATDVAEYINKPQEEQRFPLEAVLRTYYGDDVKIGVDHYPKGKKVYTVPYLTITEQEINFKYPSGAEPVQLYLERKEEEPQYGFVVHQGMDFKCRYIYDLESAQEAILVVCDNAILSYLDPERNDLDKLNENICYYATPDEMNLSNKELYQLIKTPNNGYQDKASFYPNSTDV